MTQTTLTPAAYSVPHRDTLDVAVIVTFTPSDPIGRTLVEIDGDEPPTARYLALIEAAASRLRAGLPVRCRARHSITRPRVARRHASRHTTSFLSLLDTIYIDYYNRWCEGDHPHEPSTRGPER